MWCGRDDLPVQGTGKLSLLSLPQVALYISGIAEPVLLPSQSQGGLFPQHHGLPLTQPQAQLSVSGQTQRCAELLYWLIIIINQMGNTQ